LSKTVAIRELETSDREWLRHFLREHSGSTCVVSRGVLHEAGQLPGLVAQLDGVPSAALTYHVAGGELEVVTLHSARPGLGSGSRLLEAARAKAQSLGCRRLWLITTNDNEPAIRFYERRGMTLVAVHHNAIALSRQLKPEIPLFGVDGKPIRDEIEFEVRLAMI